MSQEPHIMIIRRRYHYAAVYLSPEPVGSTKALCGQSLSVWEDGQDINTHFEGFVDRNHITDDNQVQITNITGFTMDKEIFGDWIEL